MWLKEAGSKQPSLLKVNKLMDLILYCSQKLKRCGHETETKCEFQAGEMDKGRTLQVFRGFETTWQGMEKGVITCRY